MKITLKGKEYDLHYSIRALFYFEKTTKKTFSIDNTEDNFVFFYCLLLASNYKDTDIISFDDFIDEIDNDPSIIEKFNDMLIEHKSKENFLDKDDNKKKKAKVSK